MLGRLAVAPENVAYPAEEVQLFAALGPRFVEHAAQVLPGAALVAPAAEHAHAPPVLCLHGPAGPPPGGLVIVPQRVRVAGHVARRLRVLSDGLSGIHARLHQARPAGHRAGKVSLGLYKVVGAAPLLEARPAGPRERPRVARGQPRRLRVRRLGVPVQLPLCRHVDLVEGALEQVACPAHGRPRAGPGGVAPAPARRLIVPRGPVVVAVRRHGVGHRKVRFVVALHHAGRGLVAPDGRAAHPALLEPPADPHARPPALGPHAGVPLGGHLIALGGPLVHSVPLESGPDAGAEAPRSRRAAGPAAGGRRHGEAGVRRRVHGPRVQRPCNPNVRARPLGAGPDGPGRGVPPLGLAALARLEQRIGYGKARRAAARAARQGRGVAGPAGCAARPRLRLPVGGDGLAAPAVHRERGRKAEPGCNPPSCRPVRARRRGRARLKAPCRLGVPRGAEHCAPPPCACLFELGRPDGSGSLRAPDARERLGRARAGRQPVAAPDAPCGARGAERAVLGARPAVLGGRLGVPALP